MNFTPEQREEMAKWGNKDIYALLEDIGELEEKNATLKEALTKYAEPKNWISDGAHLKRFWIGLPIETLGYTIACRALGIEEEAG